MNNLKKFGLEIPEILLPKNIDTSTWSVIACDQYTQNHEYWKKVEETAKNNPSTLNLILPEVYLNSSDKTDRIKKIRQEMKNYMEKEIFAPAKKEFIYVERTTAYGRTRHGLVAAIDLETYEWKPFSKALIRATEATILDRIPPRMEIRKGAPLELPHIMLLVNDPEHILVEQTGDEVKASGEKPVYDGNLMQNGGKISGWGIEKAEQIEKIEKSLAEIAKANTDSDGSVFMFAVGDGNHSLATAKSVWEEYKKELTIDGLSNEEIAKSRVRYALVEIVNIYDTGLTFEPIHRVLFNADSDKLIQTLKEKLGGQIIEGKDEKTVETLVKESKNGASFGFVSTKNGKTTYTVLQTEIKELAVARLQPEIDAFIEKEDPKKEKIEMDYIHGSEELFSLGKKENALSILLPPIAKDSFFATINGRGPLPRKSFSMGEADEKRFYMECRKLF